MIKKIKEFIRYRKLIFNNKVEYAKWLLIKKGHKPVDYTKGCGYYLTGGYFSGLFSSIRIGSIVKDNINGKLVIMELINYKNYYDPADMTKWSTWHIIGIFGEKMKKHCTFEEYLKLY